MQTEDALITNDMTVYKTISPQRLQMLIDYIRTDTTGWKAVDVSIEDNEKPDIEEIAARVRKFFGKNPGAIFICGARKILTLVRLDNNINLSTLKSDIDKRLPEYSCCINTGTVTREGLDVIAIRLKSAEVRITQEPLSPPTQAASNAFGLTLLRKRIARPRHVFLIVDDDLFMRSLLSKALSPYGEIVELDDGKKLLSSYQEHVPDIVFLDIHLPSGSGVDLLEDIIQYDHTASVVILSADRIKDNVLLAQAKGARSFIAKPFTREKIEDSMHKCLKQSALQARQ